MDLIVLIGSGAVGKMTVGQELMKITDFRLFHNHMMIEPVIEVFGDYCGPVVGRLREVIFEEFLKTKYRGMIFTYMWAFDMQEDWDYIRSVAERFEATGGNAPQEVRLQRNATENRIRNKPSKADVELSNERLRREDAGFRLVSREGEIPFENYIRIDNTRMEPQEAARLIKDKFAL